ncbi:hypothetical protein Dimus_009492 [Dionaea muscipula]
MENSQLNFDQPLLSVRRGPSAATLAANDGRNTSNSSFPSATHLRYYKSELKSGPVRNPGAVPFQWEQMPGRPKDETTPQPKTTEKPLLAPKLPPGRTINHILKHSDEASKDSALSMARGDSSLPAPPVSSVVKNLSEVEVSMDEMEEENMSTAEDEDSTYVDALDTLSRTESVFMNSPFSGVSGVDGFAVEPLSSFTDQHARDFMMGRFLPAAQAVASEKPQFASRRQEVVKEEPKLPKKAIKWDMQSTIYFHRTLDEREEEGDDNDSEDHESKGTENWSAKGCGLFPQFCLMNPIPGMRDKVGVRISSVRRVHGKPASASSNTRNEICVKNAAKANKTVVYSRKPIAPAHSSERGCTEENLKLKLDKSTYVSDSRTTDESFKDRRLIPDGIAPYRNAIPHSFFHEGKRFLGVPQEAKVSEVCEHHAAGKGYENSLNLLANQNATDESHNTHPAFEKTLYIDPLRMIESQSSTSSSSESRWTNDSRRRTPSVDYALQDDKYVNCAEEKAAPESRSSDVVDSVLSSMTKSSPEVQDEMKKSEHDKNPKLEPHVMSQLKLNDGQKPDMVVQKLAKEDAKTTKSSNQRILLPPPLPKSPSESWLSRTLPSMCSRNLYSRLHAGVQLHQRNQGTFLFPADSKWEAMVKSSDSHHRNLHLAGNLHQYQKISK